MKRRQIRYPDDHITADTNHSAYLMKNPKYLFHMLQHLIAHYNVDRFVLKWKRVFFEI
jgi:hypothetical protein